MSRGSLQRWCDPRVILAATNLHDAPALMRHAVDEAKRSAARLLLVHVIPSAAQPEDNSASPARVLLNPTKQNAADALEHVALQLRWQGVFCEPVVLKGRSDEQICSLVQSRGIDRVIVAAPGHSGGAASPRDSLAELLIAALPVPVCVVGNRVYPDNPCSSAAGRILLALSLHSLRREYVSFACGLARSRGARLTLLHVLEPSALGAGQTHDAARFHLAALAANYDDLSWRIEIAVREGDPATQIVEEAACPFQDLIVLGSSSLAPSQRKESKIIHQVIAEARCPVITLKSPFAELGAVPVDNLQVLRAG